ncbi:hypothetical protein ACFTAO_46630 [Paenibacillus rhizoplanae]
MNAAQKEVERLAAEIAEAARRSFSALFLRMGSIIITALYIQRARDMHQASLPGRGKRWSRKRPDRQRAAAHRQQRSLS